jgi:hypothetical protein
MILAYRVNARWFDGLKLFGAGESLGMGLAWCGAFWRI